MAEHAEAVSGWSGSWTRVVVVKRCEPKTREDLDKFTGEVGKLTILANMAARSGCPFAVPGGLGHGNDGREYCRDYIQGKTLEALMAGDGQNPDAAVFHIEAILRQLAKGPLIGSVDAEGEGYYRAILDAAPDSVDTEEARLQWEDLRSNIHDRDFPVVPLGFNHGDLAFDNIIVDEAGVLWLIDPLVNRFETPWWDVGKVLQSTYCDWPALRRGEARAPDPILLEVAEAVLAKRNRRTALFFLMLVLLRIIRHAPKQTQKVAILTEATRIGREYVGIA